MLAPYPARDIPVSLSLTYLNNAPKGVMLSTALQVANEFLSFVSGKRKIYRGSYGRGSRV